MEATRSLDILQRQSAAVIREGSKSFSLASLVFDRETRDAAHLLYRWCRYCDDHIDEAGSRAKAVENLKYLRAQTELALKPSRALDAPFVALAEITSRFAIPAHYSSELLNGMEMDVLEVRYDSVTELHRYCYRVASTVGLMMTHIMGVRSEEALRHASDMGLAMQLTNIARDVLTDAKLGRIYLPLDWLREAGVPPDPAELSAHKEGLARVTRRLLDEAAKFYRAGDKGLRYLDFRAAVAVASARWIYSAIGRKVERRGSAAWDQRVVVSWVEKTFCIAVGFIQTVWSRFQPRGPRQNSRIETVWRFQ